MSRQTSSSPVSRVAPEAVHKSAPAFGWYSDHVLFHRIWNRPNLSRRDRSIVTVSALATCGHYAQLNGHWNRALDHGLSPNEVIELITHLAFQAGWPNAMSTLRVAREVFEQRGISLDSITQAIGSSIDLDLHETDSANTTSISSAPFTAVLAGGLEELVERDVWRRSGLTLRERCFSTLATVVALQNSEQIIVEARRGLENGLTLRELCEVVLHLGYYVGLPKARFAARALDSVLGSSGIAP